MDTESSETNAVTAQSEVMRNASGGFAMKLRAYIALTKPRVMELLLITTAPTMILAGGAWPGWWPLLATLIGGAASSGSAAAFNMYLDRDMDAVMRRTADRPIVTGAVSPRAALLFAWALAVFSTVWFALVVNVIAALLSVAAIVWYVVIYTMWLKRRSPQNIVWGGLAGCFPVLIAWAAVTGALAWPPVVLLGVVFFWTPAHYWPLSMKYADDYRRAGVPMLGAIRPAVFVAVRVLGYAILTAACSLLLIPVAGMGVVYSVTALGVGAWFVTDAVRTLVAFRRRPESAKPMRVFVTSNMYLALLFIAVAVDPFVTL